MVDLLTLGVRVMLTACILCGAIGALVVMYAIALLFAWLIDRITKGGDE